jgi:hypothetical protein
VSQRLILPFCILVAVVVGYVRWTNAERNLPAPSSYADLVKATQGSQGDAGSALACAAKYTVQPPEASSAPDAGLRRAEVLDALMKKTSGLTDVERDLKLHWLLEAEVMNGGFHQFFFNSTGDEALATREAVARIGPPQLMELYDCALSAFPNGKPEADRAKRNAQLSQWGEAQFELFAPLDRTFRAMSVDEAAEAYIATHLGPAK